MMAVTLKLMKKRWWSKEMYIVCML